MLTTAISFIISYVANCLPVPTKGYEDRLKDCYHRAVDKWNVPQDVKYGAKDDMARHFVGLKKIVTHTSGGRCPKEYELLSLWAEEILADSHCHQFILSIQHEIMQVEMQKGFLKVDDVLKAINNQKEELQKIAQKVKKLLNRGVYDAKTYWDIWATGADGLKLQHDIVLSGRESDSDRVLEACHTPMFLIVESTSLSDAIAFSAATIIKKSPKNISRTFIINDTETYKLFLEKETSLIIITNVKENHNYAVSKGHSVIWCGTPADKSSYASKLVLPSVDRAGFQQVLEACGFEHNAIISLISETKRDTALLRRLLGINNEKEVWLRPEYNRYYIPAILLGSWDETRDGDKQIAESLAGMGYVEFDKGLQFLLNSDEPPLVKVGNIWQVSSPKQLITRVLNELSNDTIKNFKECIDWILEDDDPDVIAKRDANDLQFWQDKHLYSEHLRTGLLQSITIIAVVMESQQISTAWIDAYIASKLKDFSLERFLSNKNNLQWIAECSPSSFLTYIEDDVKAGMPILNKVFEIKHPKFSFIGSEIYYSELLFCLEQLAWDKIYLPRVTAILLNLCRFPNDSNYVNSPNTSLYNIYRFILPQTLVVFSQRLEILKSLSKQYTKELSELLYKLLDGIKQPVLMSSSHFRWRYNDQIKSPKYISGIPADDVIAATKLLLSIIEINTENICKLIDLATKEFMVCSHSLFMSTFEENEVKMKGNEVIVECLRKEINHHLRFKTAKCSIQGEQLEPFQELLSRIESDDVIIKNKHYFDNYLVKDDIDSIERDYQKKINESRLLRKDILNEIIAAKGWDGIWNLSHCVGNKDGLAEAILELTDSSKRQDVFRLYCDKRLDNQFVRAYFRALFFDLGKEKYLQYIEELKAVSTKEICIVLYAPYIVQEITSIVDAMPVYIQKEYWENVVPSGLTANNVRYAVERLRSVGRFSDIFNIVHNKEFIPLIGDQLWLEILFDCFNNDHINILRQYSYHIADIIKYIQIPKDSLAKRKLLLLELVLFEHIRDYLSESEYHLLQIVNNEPEMMMEIVKLAYTENEEYRGEQELSETERNIKIVFAQFACYFLFKYYSVPGTKQDGTIDEIFLREYLLQLQICAERCHRQHILPIIIGRIIGNMPETNDYPSDLMCELVEEYADDRIDTEISCCISNRRGASSRSAYDGGDIERTHIATFRKYLNRAITRSPRLTKVFENEIKSYESMAAREDERGRLNDLRY